MSVKSCNSDQCQAKGQIVRSGYVKKLKTARKKWFVLRAETEESPACLEYYDTEKKFNNGQAPKKSIPIKTCFNINKRKDTKHKNVVALYTKDEVFGIQLDSDEEADSWLKALLSLQYGEDTTDGETPKPTYEHVWQVRVVDRGIGTIIIGTYSLCLKEKNLKLIKKESNIVVDLNLTNIRSCGHLKEYVLCEVGRSSSLGPGELWMEAADENIAQSIYSTVYHAMSSNTSNELGPKSRIRSSSATETSKPNPSYRKQNPSGLPKSHIFQQAGGLNWSGNICHQRTQSLPLAHPTTTTTAPTFTDQNTTTTSHPLRVNKRPSSKCTSGGGRERCDSMPTRPRTTSEGNHSLPVWTAKSLLPPYRSHNKDISHSPPSDSPVSPPSVGCSTESSGSCYSLADEQDVNQEIEMIGRHSHPLTPDEAIAEEDSPDSPYGNSNYMSMGPQAPASSDDGYVDMSPKGRHNTLSPTHSMNSVTSGTPSTEMRFCEFTLEKVSSYFTPSEDSDTRPTRAYSVGSRPDTYHTKKHVELVGTPENSRVRAFSVGSKKVPCRVLHHHSHTNAKSSSAPILSGRTFSSHGSLGQMDDLMEMDFSQSNSSSSAHAGSSDYMDMKPGSTTPSGYVEMKPGSLENRATIPESAYVDMSGSSPARSNDSFLGDSRISRDYADMKKTVSFPPKTIPPQQTSQSDLFDLNSYTVRKVDRHGSFSSSFYSASPKLTEGWVNSHHNNGGTLTTITTTTTTPDGYMEMNLGSNKHQRQSSFDSAQIKPQLNEDYADMSVGNNTLRRKFGKSEASQPIAIQGRNLNNKNSSPSSISPHQIGRKYSTGTPPSLHLQLSNQCSTIPRPRSRKNSRRDSKDSSSSSVTTPSSSSTIFSMSPCSPVKPITKQIKVPASVLNTPYKPSTFNHSEDYTMMDYEKPAPKRQDNSEYVNYNPAPSRKVSQITPIKNDNIGDYAIMKPGGVVESQPESKKVITSTAAASGSSIASKIYSIGFHPINDNNIRTSPKPGDTVPELSNSTESLKETARSRIIDTKNESPRSASVSCDNGKTTTVTSRPSSTSSELCSSTSTLTPSRPESVNSDRISALNESTRPASVSCDGQLHYASLDLAPVNDDMGNRSPRTTKTVQTDVNHQTTCEPAFTYAQIDFVKSEGLKHNSLPNNAKVKH